MQQKCQEVKTMERGKFTLFRQLLRSRVLWITGVFFIFIWLNNTSLCVDRIDREPTLVAHRALGQTFDLEGVKWNTNTAAIIHEPEHPYIGNTLPSIRAAFEYGADIVEFDIRLTADNRLAVFHDDLLENQTDGTGHVSNHTMDELKRLDVGHGFTADNGQSFPLRGTGVGLMVSIEEVFRTFPDRNFLIHIKDGGEKVGLILLDFLNTLDSSSIDNISVYGNDQALDLIENRYPDMKTLSKQRVMDALLKYEIVGWTGFVPQAIRNMELHIPAKYAGFLWGWPDRFLQRMDRANTRVVLVRYVNGWSDGFDSEADLLELPREYTGGVWTNRIDVTGPLLKE